MLFAASGIENIVVVIGDDKPSDDSTKDDIEDGDFKGLLENHKGRCWRRRDHQDQAKQNL